MSLLFVIGHETGDLTEYTSTVPGDGDLEAHTDAGLHDTTYGLKCTIDDTVAIYGTRNETVPASNEIRFRAYIDPNGLTMAAADLFNFLQPRSSGPQLTLCNLSLYRTAGGDYQIRTTATEDTGSAAPDFATISDDEHYVEVHIVRATSDVASDGTVQWWVDGADQGTWVALDNFDVFGNMTAFRIGVFGSIDAGTSGVLYLDQIAVRDDSSEIGNARLVTGVSDGVSVADTDAIDPFLVALAVSESIGVKTPLFTLERTKVTPAGRSLAHAGQEN